MKKLTALLFALTMLFTSTACKGKKNSKVTETPAAVSISQTTYGIEEVFLDVHDMYYEQHMTVYDDGIFLFYCSVDQKLKFVRTDKEFNIVSSAVIADDAMRSAAYNVNADGSFDIVVADTDFEFEYDDNQQITNYEEYCTEAEFTLRLINFDSEGNIISQCDIKDAGKYFDLETSNLCDLVPCGEDSFMLNFGSGLAVFSTDGKLIDIDAGRQYDDCSITKASDGSIIFTQFGTYGYMNPDSVDVPSGLKPIGEEGESCGSAVTGSGDFKAYFDLSDGLYGMTESDDLIMVINYRQSLMTNTFGNINPFSEGKFISYSNDNKLMVYTRRPDDYVEKRTALDFWMVETGGTFMDYHANNFCALEDKYYINIRGGVDFDDVPTAILAGEGPDILYYNRTGDMYKLVNMGGLADLTPYLDGDTGISRDELMSNVLEAYEYKGGLYTLPESFIIELIMAKKDFIGEEYRNWSINDFLEIYDSRPQGMAVFDDTSLKGLLCSEDIWTDPEKGTCNYDSEEFIRILEICKKEEKNNSDLEYGSIEWTKNQLSLFKDDKTMLGGAQSTSLVGMQFLLSYLGQRDLSIDDVSLLNLPGSGSGKISMHAGYSILATSDCPEGAWEFISYLLNEEQQSAWADMGHPINKKAFETSIEKLIHMPGGLVESGAINGLEYSYSISVSEEQVRRYYDFVENCRTLSYSDRDIYDIFNEEYDRFVNDEITAKECAYNIQGRVEILLAEAA